SVRADPHPLARRHDQVTIRRLLPGTRIEKRAIRGTTVRSVPPISHGESLRMAGDGDAAELETVRDGDTPLPDLERIGEGVALAPAPLLDLQLPVNLQKMVHGNLESQWHGAPLTRSLAATRCFGPVKVDDLHQAADRRTTLLRHHGGPDSSSPMLHHPHLPAHVEHGAGRALGRFPIPRFPALFLP